VLDDSLAHSQMRFLKWNDISTVGGNISKRLVQCAEWNQLPSQVALDPFKVLLNKEKT